MAYLEEAELVARARSISRPLLKSASQVLLEATAATGQRFDVFLSHSTNEPEDILLGVKNALEGRGLSVYVDKYSDPQLSPEDVTRETAEVLRGRMRDSSALLYVHSRHSKLSRWMPWELGFFDGLKSRVGVLPVANAGKTTYGGEEYLALYPYVDIVPEQKTKKPLLWINQAPDTYASLVEWVRGTARITKRTR